MIATVHCMQASQVQFLSLQLLQRALQELQSSGSALELELTMTLMLVVLYYMYTSLSLCYKFWIVPYGSARLLVVWSFYN